MMEEIKNTVGIELEFHTLGIASSQTKLLPSKHKVAEIYYEDLSQYNRVLLGEITTDMDIVVPFRAVEFVSVPLENIIWIDLFLESITVFLNKLPGDSIQEIRVGRFLFRLTDTFIFNNFLAENAKHHLCEPQITLGFDNPLKLHFIYETFVEDSKLHQEIIKSFQLLPPYSERSLEKYKSFLNQVGCGTSKEQYCIIEFIRVYISYFYQNLDSEALSFFGNKAYLGDVLARTAFWSKNTTPHFTNKISKESFECCNSYLTDGLPDKSNIVLKYRDNTHPQDKALEKMELEGFPSLHMLISSIFKRNEKAIQSLTDKEYYTHRSLLVSKHGPMEADFPNDASEKQYGLLLDYDFISPLPFSSEVDDDPMGLSSRRPKKGDQDFIVEIRNFPHFLNKSLEIKDERVVTGVKLFEYTEEFIKHVASLIDELRK